MPLSLKQPKAPFWCLPLYICSFQFPDEKASLKPFPCLRLYYKSTPELAALVAVDYCSISVTSHLSFQRHKCLFFSRSDTHIIMKIRFINSNTHSTLLVLNGFIYVKPFSTEYMTRSGRTTGGHSCWLHTLSVQIT